MHVTRRGVLVGAAIGGGLVAAWGLRPRRFGRTAQRRARRGRVRRLAEDRQGRGGHGGRAAARNGPGCDHACCRKWWRWNSGADWRQIAVEPAPVSGAYANLPLAAKWAPLWQPLITVARQRARRLAAATLGRDRALHRHRRRHVARGLRGAVPQRAAASARALLAMAAADRWDVELGRMRGRKRLHRPRAATG